ncbi:MAG: hypothetical protein NVS2B7_32490 [Herpetosiphon sp.]
MLWSVGGPPPVGLLYFLAFGIAVGAAYFGPARAAAMPDVVVGSHLVQANALDRFSGALTNTLAWAGSGVIVTLLGPRHAIEIDTATFLVSWLVVRLARWDESQRLKQNRHKADAAAWLPVLSYFRSSRLAQIVLSAQLVHALGAGCFFAGIAPLLQRQLHTGPAFYGIQGAVFGTAMMVGAALIGGFSSCRVGWMISLGIVVNGAGNSLFALAPTTLWLLMGAGIAGIGATPWQTGEVTLIQDYVPAGIRGRYLAMTRILAQSVVMPAIAVGGWLVDHGSVGHMMFGASVVHMLIGAALWLYRPLRDYCVEASTL